MRALRRSCTHMTSRISRARATSRRKTGEQPVDEKPVSKFVRSVKALLTSVFYQNSKINFKLNSSRERQLQWQPSIFENI